MIIKTISRKSNVDQLIKYVLADHKLEPLAQKPERRFYVPGIKLTKEDIRHLESERVDAGLLAQLKAYSKDGNIREFVMNVIAPPQQAGTEKGDGSKKFNAIVIKENLRSRSVKGYIREFEDNEKFRLNARKDNVKAYHHILSFSHLDRKDLNEAALKDIAQKFISLRGYTSLFVGAVHQDRDHIHIHLVQSGVQYCTGIANRVTRQQYQELKKSMQEYQLEKYPQLIHSLPDHGRKGNELGKVPEKNIKTSERILDKNILLGLLETTFAKAVSKEDFLSQIKAMGHEPYYRAGRLQGIKYDGERKFRLNNLGFGELKLQELDMKEKSLRELSTIRNGIAQRTRGAKDRQVPIEESIKGMSDEKQREKLQELVDLDVAFERKHNISRDTGTQNMEETQLQELRSIRESNSVEMDKSAGFEQNGRDMAEDRNADDDRDYKVKTDSKMDEDAEDEDSGNSFDDAGNDDGDDDVQ